MRMVLTSIAALALAGCAGAYSGPVEIADAPPPAVTQSMPAQMASLDPSDSILFWSDDRRSAAFRDMESMFAGLEVAPANAVRVLEPGAPMSAATVSAIRAFMDETQAAGVMVLQDGKVRFEDYTLGLGAEDRWTSFSVAKSFTSTLLGAAIEDGHVESIETPVTSIIPALSGTAYEGVTVGQIATMTSGVAWNENYSDPNSDVAKMLAIAPVAGESQAVTYARTLEREAPAGEKWVYKTLETNLLGLIVEEATGKSLAAYAAEKIVEPAGFAGGMFWMQDLTGGNIGGCCLSLRLSDYARFGQFVMEGGEGVVPADWFAESGKAQVSFGPNAPGFGYGYQWWAYPQGSYGAQGIFGQSITLVPESDLVVAVVSNWPTATSSENRSKARQIAAMIAAEVQ
ncbi:serine hydrolase domain-containing protein [Qipengyuania psychrotolerans]|uniref:Beta-lactamase family protein n=1 Tax=Qipengyuania psychrotolerans TaxID=2867238 RepID=A0ABX8ZKA8_9SPHN|nr:serine hydrolase [Qipengyuania psychrotolerans]QZD88124.1 beta-lactamase family protein [Qipengyuania psychrotolerans]